MPGFVIGGHFPEMKDFDKQVHSKQEVAVYFKTVQSAFGTVVCVAVMDVKIKFVLFRWVGIERNAIWLPRCFNIYNGM